VSYEYQGLQSFISFRASALVRQLHEVAATSSQSLRGVKYVQSGGYVRVEDHGLRAYAVRLQAPQGARGAEKELIPNGGGCGRDRNIS
jgi:hypothetical protein